MNFLVPSGVNALVFLCFLVLALFVLRAGVVALHGTPAGEGLAALAL